MGITLQINLCAGDIAYAEQCVPHLVNSHRKNVEESLAIVDLCKPQSTKFFNSEERFPSPNFEQKLKKICEIAESLKNQGYFDRIEYLKPGSNFLKNINEKYFQGILEETHDCGGITLVGYLAGIEHAKSRFVLHYDADMLLYQEEGYDWAQEAKTRLESEPLALSATPRISPPFTKHFNLADGPSRVEARNYYPVQSGWRNDWFSARCYLLDRQKFSKQVPLLRGITLRRAKWGKFLYKYAPPHNQLLSFNQLKTIQPATEKLLHIAKTIKWKYIDPLYPPPYETMLFENSAALGQWSLNLKSEKAWLLHPSSKPPEYLKILPIIISKLKEAKLPIEQCGIPDIVLPAWYEYARDE